MKYTVNQVKGYDLRVKLNKTVYFGYTPKELKKRYPKDGYSIVGEIKPNSDKKKIGELVDSGAVVSELKAHSRVLNKEKGYLSVEADTFLVVLRSRIPFIILFFGGLLIALLIALMVFSSDSPIAINPDAPLPDISPIVDDDSVKPIVGDGSGSVTMIWTLNATANLSDGKVEVYFKNPNASTHDVEVELYVVSNGEEFLIARSDRVKAGYALNRMDILKSITLSEGIYTGIYRVTGYDPETGEKAAYMPEIPDVLITAKY